MSKKQVFAWEPQAGPQQHAVQMAFIQELFFGGAAYGGKSDYLLGDFLLDVPQGVSWQGVLFRQTYPSLEGLISRSQEIFPATGAKWLEGKGQWDWPNGARLKFRHMESEADFIKYQGHSYAWVGWDELVEWAPGPNGGPSPCYRKMLSRLRGPAKNKRIRATGNPGGVGHAWVQEYFKIPRHPVGYQEMEPFYDAATKHYRLFVPSRVEDNKIGLADDPGYMDRLEGVGDAELVRAWKEGDWNALVGSYFAKNWSKVELTESFEIPDSWRMYAGLDYGEASPTCWLLGAVDYDKNLWILNEYYRADRAASEHAREIREQLDEYPFARRKPSVTLADPSMWARRRLTEMQVISAADAFKDRGVYLKPGNNNRVNGWRIVNDLMAKGRLRIFREWCPNLIRTLPMLPRDLGNSEDVDTDSEDHAADALRYMAVHIYGPGRARAARAEDEGGRLIDSLVMPKTLTRYG